ncbi:hypothetical protein LTR16_011753, partial [Cryomyces antarcticus]
AHGLDSVGLAVRLSVLALIQAPRIGTRWLPECNHQGAHQLQASQGGHHLPVDGAGQEVRSERGRDRRALQSEHHLVSCRYAGDVESWRRCFRRLASLQRRGDDVCLEDRSSQVPNDHAVVDASRSGSSEERRNTQGERLPPRG